MLDENNIQLFNDEIAIVTGGGTGIGKAIAERLAKMGALVVITGRNNDRLEKVASEINSQGKQCVAIRTNIRDPDDVNRLMDKVINLPGSLTMLINNAAANFVTRFENLSLNGWNAIVETVLTGTYLCTSLAGNVMIKRQNHGRILNIVATSAWTGGPGTVASAAAKAGVVAMTKSVSVEWARFGIRINALAPGPTWTAGASRQLFPDKRKTEALISDIPLGRFATLDEIVGAAIFLLDPNNSYCTGAVLAVDGGRSLSKGYFSQHQLNSNQ